MIFKGIVVLDKENGFGFNNSPLWNDNNGVQYIIEKTKNGYLLMEEDSYLHRAKQVNYPINSKLFDATSIVLTFSDDIFLSDSVLAISNINHLYYIGIDDDIVWIIGDEYLFNRGLELCIEWHLVKTNKTYCCDKFFDIEKLNNNYNLNKCILDNENMSIEIWNKKT